MSLTTPGKIDYDNMPRDMVFYAGHQDGYGQGAKDGYFDGYIKARTEALEEAAIKIDEKARLADQQRRSDFLAMTDLITREQLEKEWANEPTVVMSRAQFIEKCLAMQDNGLEGAARKCDDIARRQTERIWAASVAAAIRALKGGE